MSSVDSLANDSREPAAGRGNGVAADDDDVAADGDDVAVDDDGVAADDDGVAVDGSAADGFTTSAAASLEGVWGADSVEGATGSGTRGGCEKVRVPKPS